MAPQLKAKITIDATSALKALASVKGAMNSLRTFTTQLNAGFGVFMKPLEIAGKASAGLASALGLVVIAGAKASSEIEMLKTQLEAVLATQEEAQQAFKESYDFSIRTPFEPRDIIQSRIELEGIGVKGKRAVESVAAAAGALNRNIIDVTAAVKSLETEQLRRLGIIARQTGDEFKYHYVNKMGEARDIVVNGFANAQQAVLGIFDEKFADGLRKMSLTASGKLSTLKGAMQAFFADFGEGFLDELKIILDDLIRLFSAASAKEFGQTVGKYLNAAWENMRAAFTVALRVSAMIGEHLAKGGAGLGEIINSSITSALGILGDAFLASIKASFQLWKIVGSIIGSAILGELLKVPLAQSVRTQMLKGLSDEEIRKRAEQVGVSIGKASKKEFDFAPGGRAGLGYKAVDVPAFELASRLSAEDQAKLLSAVPPSMTEDAIKGAESSFKNIFKALIEGLDEERLSWEETINRVTEKDINLVTMFEAEKKAIQEQRAANEAAIQALGEAEASIAAGVANNIASITQSLTPLRGFFAGGYSINQALSPDFATRTAEEAMKKTSVDQLNETKKQTQLLEAIATRSVAAFSFIPGARA